MLLFWSYLSVSENNNMPENIGGFLKEIFYVFCWPKIVAEERKSVLSEQWNFLPSFPNLSLKKSPFVTKKK